MPIITKSVYICNQCDTESTNPTKWLKFTPPLMGNYYLGKDKVFCSPACVQDWAIDFADQNTEEIFVGDIVSG